MQGGGTAGRLSCAAVMIVAVACAPDRPARPPTVAFLGDSITYGILRGPRGGRATEVDPHGGYPGRLARRLGDRARVVNRGIGGATTGLWLAPPQSAMGRPMWALIERAPWFEPGLAPTGESVAVAVLAGARPDVVVLLLGVNDVYLRRLEGGVGVEAALDGLVELARQSAIIARVVLVATPLPNRRDPEAHLAALTAGIHARFSDALPLGERFATLEWRALLADEVHPNRAGYERIAMLLEAMLIERGLVAPPAR